MNCCSSSLYIVCLLILGVWLNTNGFQGCSVRGVNIIIYSPKVDVECLVTSGSVRVENGGVWRTATTKC